MGSNNHSVDYSNIVQAIQPLKSLSTVQLEQIKGISLSMTNAMSATMRDIAINNNGMKESLSVLQDELSQIGNHYTNIVASMNIPSSMMSDALRSFSYQTEAFKQLITIPQTTMTEELRGYMSTLNIDGCVSAMQQAFSGSLIHASDLALAKNSSFGQSLIAMAEIPVGISEALSNLNRLTSKALEHDPDIMYDVPNKEYIDDSKECYTRANASEMNSIGYAFKVVNVRILDDRTEFVSAKELMNFMTVLSETKTFASDHPVGRTIFAKICEMWDHDEYVGLDNDYYYHARTVNEESAPYTYREMLKAPHGVTGPGRFNYPGEAYYYTADSLDGAKREVRIHNKNSRIQVVKIKPDKPAKLLDLFEPMRWGREFLKYVRFTIPENNNSYMPREYLIPNYVSDCCRKIGFDGIKYYGGKDYCNYVTWRDGFYNFVEML